MIDKYDLGRYCLTLNTAYDVEFFTSTMLNILCNNMIREFEKTGKKSSFNRKLANWVVIKYNPSLCPRLMEKKEKYYYLRHVVQLSLYQLFTEVYRSINTDHDMFGVIEPFSFLADKYKVEEVNKK